jgi:hypothetical protein
LEPSGNKGIFVGYCDTSKAYIVYFHGHRNIETSRDVPFNEDTNFSRLKHNNSYEFHDKELEAPRVVDTNAGNDVVLEDHNMEEQ